MLISKMLNKRKLNKREKNIICIFLILSISALAYNIISTVSASLANIETDIAQSEQRLFKLKSIVSKSRELNSEYEKTASRYKGAGDYDSLLQDISNIAKRLDVNILNIKPAIVNDDAKLKTYLIKIQSQCDVSSFAMFLNRLTEELKNVGVERVQIEAQGKDELPLISVSMKTALFKE